MQSKKDECKSLEIGSQRHESVANTFKMWTGASSGVPYGWIAGLLFTSLGTIFRKKKYNANIQYIEQECDDIPFDEIKEILSDRFQQVDDNLNRNYGAIIKNLEIMKRNYQGIKHVRDKVDNNFIAIHSGFKSLTDQLKKARVEEVTSKLTTFIELFHAKQSALTLLPPEELVVELKEENGILHHLQVSKLPQLENSLYELLNDVINREFAIPKNSDDEYALATLALLCLGTETYVSILYFLHNGYSYLANDSCQDGDIGRCNQYISVSLRILKDFTNSLLGFEGVIGLFDKVISVLIKVKSLDFLKNDKQIFIELISKKIDRLEEMKSTLYEINNLPNIEQSVQIKYDFTYSSIKTPFIGWQDRRKVSYAIQYMDREFYSQVSDWSVPYTVYGRACPQLDIGVAPQGKTRIIYRKFDNDKAELVGVIEDSEQIEFRDIHRDLYNSALEANEEIALLDIAKLIDNGANITATFEKRRQAIHAAAKSGNLKTVLALLEKGAGINERDANGYTPLHIASISGYENFIKELINYGADVNAISYLNWTPLHLAAERGHVRTINSLLQSDKIDLNVRAAGGFTPLHLVVSSSNMNAVAVLSSDDRTDINAQSEKKLAALHLAVLGRYKETVKTLLNSRKIDVNLGSQGNLTALHLAAVAGNVKIVKQLIRHYRTDVNARSEDDWTPLHLAISLKKKRIIQNLLNSTEIDVNVECKDKITPLHLASCTGQNDVILKLLDKNAELEAREKDGYTPLYAAVKEGHYSTVKILVESGANVNAQNTKDETPLMLGACNEQPDIIQFFLQKELVDFDIQNSMNNSFVHYAAREGCLEIIKYLSDVNKVDIHVKNNSGETSLHFAAAGGNVDIVKYLIDTKHMNVNVRSAMNETPLHFAVRYDKLEVVKYLVEEKGADLNVKSFDYPIKYPLHYAVRYGCMDIVRYFIDDRKVDFNVKAGLLNYTLLDLALMNDELNVMRYLIDEKGVDLHFNPKYPIFNLPLHFAVDKGDVDRDYPIRHNYMDPYSFESVYFYGTPLHRTNEKKNLEIIKYLIEAKGMNINVKDKMNNTVLHLAAEYGYLKIVEYLTKYKHIDINVINARGHTPLHLACINGHLDIVRHLVDTKGADFNIKDTFHEVGLSPLQYAVRHNRLAIVKYFIDEKKIDLKITTDHNETLLHLSTKFGLEVARYLIDEKQMDPNLKDHIGNTVLHSAALNGNLEVVKYLVDIKGVDFNVKNQIGYTPLQSAIFPDCDRACTYHFANPDRYRVIRYFIDDKKIDINIKTDQGQSLLHLAASNGCIEIVKYFIDIKEMDPIANDQEGNTPLHYASLKNNSRVVIYLLSDKQVDINIKNNKHQTSLQLAKDKRVISILKRKWFQRSRRSITTNRKQFEEEKLSSRFALKNYAGDTNVKLGIEANGEKYSVEDKKVKNESKNKSVGGIRDSYTEYSKGVTDKDALLSISEIRWTENDTVMGLRIGQDVGSTWESINYAATSYENAPFIKWLFYFLGRRNFVKRVTRAEQLSTSNEEGNKYSNEDLHWIEKRLNSAKASYSKP